MWLQGEDNAPQLVKSCFASIRHHCSDYDVIILDIETIFNYISLPTVIVEKYQSGKMLPCHFADICRVELLRMYGGFWIDATCFLTSSFPKFILESDFFVFSNPWSYMFVQNCFIRAKLGNLLINLWGEAILSYWMKYDVCIDYFMHQTLFKAIVDNNILARESFNRMPRVDHFPLHKVWYYLSDDIFAQDIIDELNSQGYFFQKTSHHKITAIVPHSFKYYILNAYQS